MGRCRIRGSELKDGTWCTPSLGLVNDCGVTIWLRYETLNAGKSQIHAPSSHIGFEEGAMDWLSRLFEMMPVRGRLDLRCSYGPPWRIDPAPRQANKIPHHAV